MAKRKLSDQKERVAAISYLCGVGEEYLRDRWNISGQTLYHTLEERLGLFSERGKELVEFYRRPKRDKKCLSREEKMRNSAHLYLAFNEREVFKGELLRGNYENAYWAVWEGIYRPREERVSNSISLGDYAVPTSGEEFLLESIFGKRKGMDFFRPILLDNLEREYEEETFNLDRAFEKARRYLVRKLKVGSAGMTAEKKKELHGILRGFVKGGVLSRREMGVLRLRYRMAEGDNIKKVRLMNWEEVGSVMDVTRERVRQLEAKTIRKLQHPKRAKWLEPFYDLATEREVKSRLEQMEKEEERERWREKLYPEIKEEVLDRISQDPELKAEVIKKRKMSSVYSELPIQELDLSHRPQRTLERLGVHTLGDLEKITGEELLRQPNFGRKSLQEVREGLNSYGLGLGRLWRKKDSNLPEEGTTLDCPIEALNLSTRPTNCLRAERIRTIGELIGCGEKDLLRIWNFGEVSLREVKEKLAEYGLSLSE